ncbi:hypothetical protein K1077_003448 [Salmonella enterica]|uniref:hypothetical protein n=1 Tax=Salmonella enterica TaxID=28901 RepID=UPI0009B17C5B|nr:hypothetical protein [Salmonella enterica]ECI2946657.1 hypothetical protein [Salmonella enterica subsp. diarizonae]WGI49538.1 hypothetical protein QBX66_24070 [Salmonella enterica subsp. diarizonae serovar 48:i:z]EBD5992653.1 hypothetical protein [Salmonella enterica]ECI3369388.1 hypothetical protein [Salmonella enterica subsp. diarizonae]ECI4842194.1 hypothetical protein [Salmonella enterica subsp. diarizonae]
MTDVTLPNGKTPEEAAHELAISLVASGYFDTSKKSPKGVFRMVDSAEKLFCELYQAQLKQLQENEDKNFNEFLKGS